MKPVFSFRNLIPFALAFFGFSFSSFAQHNGTSWSEHIAPIMYANCTSCHHDGGIGGFSLVKYEEAYPYRFAMKFQVDEGKMPPWPPDPNFTHFAGELVLSDKEKELIIDWVDDGGPLGDPTKAPDPPTYDNKPVIQNPDLTVRIPDFTSIADTLDNYRCFVIPVDELEDKFISEIEIIPGNKEIVHHVLIFQDSSSIPSQLDAADPGPGYTYFGSTGSRYSSLIGGWVPGMGPTKFPYKMGVRFLKRSNIVIQMHYPAGSKGALDSTKINFRYSKTKLNRELLVLPIMGHHNIDNGPLFIKANTIDTFYQSYKAPNPGSIISVLPHMHLIGKSYKVWVERLNGDTTWLINIPEWDFHWQMVYNYRYIQVVYTDEVVRTEAVYDNTSNNPNNPSDPPKDVGLGDYTTDEMMLIFFYFTHYEDGDEDIMVDSTGWVGIEKVREQYAIRVHPNPSSDNFTFDLGRLTDFEVEYQVINDLGQVMKSGVWTREDEPVIHAEQWPSGVYWIKIEAGNGYALEALYKQ